MNASGFGFTKVVKMLIKLKADIDLQCNFGLTAIQHSCVGYKGPKRKRESCIRALLKAGASTRIPTTLNYQEFPSGVLAFEMAQSRGLDPTVVAKLDTKQRGKRASRKETRG
mmetsp:Transcript_11095/g.17752  ORF Transcript_11095/g.17752 Transcript_11095/m.17752 type:complete len:112 (-) Transcript_11095:316-651(-)